MDVEKFIQLIKNEPILYDRRLRGYKNFTRKARIWEAIASEMNESSDVLRIKWKGLKDSYTKYKKQAKEKAAGRKVSKTYYNWCWADHLQFLDDYVRRKSSTLNVTKMSRDDSLLEAHLPASLIPLTQPVTTTSISTTPPLQNQVYLAESPQNENVSEAMPSTSTRSTPVLQSPRLSKPSHIRSSISKRTYNTTSAVDDDENMYLMREKRAKQTDAVDLLFKSYAETFKNFSVRKQVSLKMKLAKLFADAEMEELQESSIEFVTPAFFSANVDGEHDYALASENVKRHLHVTNQNYSESFDVLEHTEASPMMKHSPASDNSSND